MGGRDTSESLVAIVGMRNRVEYIWTLVDNERHKWTNQQNNENIPKSPYAIYTVLYSLLHYTLLTSLDKRGLGWSSPPSYADEAIQIGLADPPLAAEAVGNEVSARDPAAYRFLGDLKNHRGLRNRQQGREPSGKLGAGVGHCRESFRGR